jgi:hypothetical protein
VKSQSNITNLGKIQLVALLKDRKNRRQQRLQKVIEKMRQAHGPQDNIGGAHLVPGQDACRLIDGAHAHGLCLRIHQRAPFLFDVCCKYHELWLTQVPTGKFHAGAST